MYVHIELLLVLTGISVVSAQNHGRVRNYVKIPANINIYYGDLAHVRYGDGVMSPLCMPLDRDIIIDIMVYDRITINHNGTYYTAGNGMVSGVGVDFQEISDSNRSFRTILRLVFPNDKELVQYFPF
ncbi:uncharacterized protein LOC132558956 [Ylistrum balloti]|uniref:uncharacterized protein LOC132558956 n=1 Tax=Ylistrum balloti TaxID=509963 RepID=UPI00290586E5|nr:uncharacterized protein LOC132558956 [Ylistrum balloti]